MPNFNIKLKPSIFNKRYLPFLYDQTRTQIFFGGSSSGKSVFIAQRCVMDVLSQKRNYLIVRNVGDTNRVSTFNEISKLIYAWDIAKLFNINKSNLEITCKNDYQIIFKGLDDVAKIKSITPKKGVITDIWAEEATETYEDGVRQLRKRLRGTSKVKKRLTLSFNPILKTHWIFKTYFGSFFDSDVFKKTDNSFILKTTYKDNQFLEPDDIAELEDETDPYWHDVYTLGNWGVLGSIIFTNWTVEDLTEKRKTFDRFKNGLDFGFTNDPTALTRSHYDRKRKTIYITDELYETGLTNPEIADKIKPLVGKEYVVCDSAEPKSIEELTRCKVSALAAEKGKDSVLFGIQWLQQQKIVVDKSCQNHINELQLYQWKKNKEGEVLNEPIDKNNHLIDALRYGYENERDEWIAYQSAKKSRGSLFQKKGCW